jgi:hypothetical protein
MWTYLGSNYPDRPFPELLSIVEVKAQMHKVLDSIATLSPSTGLDALLCPSTEFNSH